MSKSSYQELLKYKRVSTSEVSSSYSMFYNGFYIHGAYYNKQHICYVHLGYGVEYYSKSIKQVQKKIDLHCKSFKL